MRYFVALKDQWIDLCLSGRYIQALSGQYLNCKIMTIFPRVDFAKTVSFQYHVNCVLFRNIFFSICAAALHLPSPHFNYYIMSKEVGELGHIDRSAATKTDDAKAENASSGKFEGKTELKGKFEGKTELKGKFEGKTEEQKLKFEGKTEEQKAKFEGKTEGQTAKFEGKAEGQLGKTETSKSAGKTEGSNLGKFEGKFESKKDS